MKKLILTLIAALGIVTGAHAAEGGLAWDKAPNRTTDLAALQNGAKLFVNYCLSCHSAAYMRFNRLTDLGITEQQIKDNLLFTTDKIGETMRVNMDPRQAKEWFGTVPPDLTLVARSRAGHGGTGADYLYTYLRTFYRDDTKATGWNNLAFPAVAMPHVMWELQGERRPVFDKVEAHGHETEVFKGWEQVSPGTMTPIQFDQNMGDLVSFLQWMAEPAQNTRIRVGVWVLLFLVMAIVFTWRLNASYWKDVK
ncbi:MULTISPECIES: cytochrome c1 [Variovorax]|uniref:Cytochrome c1 n=1 Tax=Variovorax ginsengisoli TaxID=363844 RepID=A0ABT8RWF6_9BURK|nr:MULTISPECIES: cytochrome c1 [Variovorax]MDM0083769.1 cytochrome c1 [Variovorax sp. J31P179]MDN8611764.1 cytochrome c1 [Variovorax ginsengisoli]MDO1530934.1 cytochrome c1 [Variovorax ginsengisoli]